MKMKQQSFVHRVVTCCWILAVLTLQGWPGTSRFVICFGENGDVAIEENHKGFCVKGQDSHSPAHANPAEKNDYRNAPHHWGDCIDIPCLELDYSSRNLPGGSSPVSFESPACAKALLSESNAQAPPAASNRCQLLTEAGSIPPLLRTMSLRI